MKRNRWHLFVFIIGILLIISGVSTLVSAISENNKSGIWIRGLMLIFWIGFTVSNFLLYKKETKNKKDP